MKKTLSLIAISIILSSCSLNNSSITSTNSVPSSNNSSTLESGGSSANDPYIGDELEYIPNDFEEIYKSKETHYLVNFFTPEELKEYITENASSLGIENTCMLYPNNYKKYGIGMRLLSFRLTYESQSDEKYNDLCVRSNFYVYDSSLGCVYPAYDGEDGHIHYSFITRCIFYVSEKNNVTETKFEYIKEDPMIKVSILSDDTPLGYVYFELDKQERFTKKMIDYVKDYFTSSFIQLTNLQ